MNRTQARRLERATLDRLERLMECSKLQHGESFVRFSPLWRDHESKQRRRLYRQYWALKRGRYARG